MERKKQSLDDLVTAITPDNTHEEIVLGGPVGKEVWQPKTYNFKSHMMLACPITSKVKNYPFEVPVKAKKIDGAILPDQAKSLDWTMRNVSFVDKASHKVLEQTLDLVDILMRD